MLLRIFVVFVSVIAASLVFGKPTYKSDIKTCYKQECPDETFACERLSRISDDKKNIDTEIRCLGLSGNVLSSKNSSAPNPYGSSIHFQSYSYTGSVSLSNDDDLNNSNIDKKEDKDGKENEKDPTSGESEVDDLNKNPNTE